VDLHLRLNLKASRRLGSGDYSGAAECYREILAADPQQWSVLLLLSYCHESEGKPSEALAAAMKAVEVDPDNFLTLRALAQACVNTGDHHSAKLYIERALRAAPLPAPGMDERFFYTLGRLCVTLLRLVPRYRRRISPDATSGLYARRHVREWMVWAEKYLAWHQATFGPGSSSSVN
jgi:tetratricopeptide (TPR) repeat protein